jgi:hypothetical protein
LKILAERGIPPPLVYLQKPRFACLYKRPPMYLSVLKNQEQLQPTSGKKLLNQPGNKTAEFATNNRFLRFRVVILQIYIRYRGRVVAYSSRVVVGGEEYRGEGRRAKAKRLAYLGHHASPALHLLVLFLLRFRAFRCRRGEGTSYGFSLTFSSAHSVG